MSTRVARNESQHRPAAMGRRGRALLTLTLILLVFLAALLGACAAMAQPTPGSSEPGGAQPTPGSSEPEGAQPGPPGAQPGQPGTQPGPPGAQPEPGRLPGQGVPQQAAAAPSLTVSPALAVGTPVQWTLVFPARYCGGPQIGGYVQLVFEPPLAVPASILGGSITFADLPASVSVPDSQTLQVRPPSDAMWSQLCSNEMQEFTVVITPDAAVSAPQSAGAFTVDFSTGSDPTPQPLVVNFDDPSAAESSP